MLSASLLAITTVGAGRDFAARAKDWRIGPIVYQVMVDRFAPPASLESKREFIQAPRSLKKWTDLPTAGHLLADVGVWSHELEFWGGDLASLAGKLDYVQTLGADVLYLQPVQQAFTNHKYDAQDFAEVSPEIGTRAELLGIVKDIHRRKMRVMLDGVFNHMGRTSPLFQEALANPKSAHRDWFFIGKNVPNGYRSYAGARNMPGLRLETQSLRDYLWNRRDSIVRKYLREGVDGWRLDVAFELGPTFLGELTRAAHEERPGSAVVGEINGYPANWFPSVDGVFNFSSMTAAQAMVRGDLTGGHAGQIFSDLLQDAGVDNLLRSWLITDNHDTDRLASVVPDRESRHLVQALQFTMPGCPVLYYGTELGMTGIGDPACRAPMRWDLATPDNPDLAWIRRMIEMRQKLRALRIGDAIPLRTDRLFAFMRVTDRLADTVIVVSNPTDRTVTETIAVRSGWVQSWGTLRDQLSDRVGRAINGLMKIEVKPRSTMILVPDVSKTNGYSPYNRVP